MAIKKIIFSFIFILIIFLFSLIITPNISLAVTANNKYEQSSGADTTPPDQPSLVRLTSQNNGIVITWTDPPNTDFYQMLILRDYNSGQGNTLDNVYGFSNKGEEQFIDTGAITGQTYTYILRPRDIKNNVNTNSVQYTITHTNGPSNNTNSITPTTNPQQTTPTTNPTNTPTQTPSSPTNNSTNPNNQSQNTNNNKNNIETIDLEPIRIINNTPRFKTEKKIKDITAERSAIGPIIKLLKRLPQGKDWEFVHYIAYLGNLKDILKYQSIYNVLPQNNSEWRDLKKIARGFEPNKKSIEAESDALNLFTKIWQRTPQTKKEWHFLHIIAYDLIPQKRNLKKESSAILLVKKIPNIIFRSNKFWRLVHAYSYM